MSRAIPESSRSRWTRAKPRRSSISRRTGLCLPSARVSERPEFPVPLHGFRWLPTRQPVVTDLWHTDAPPAREGGLYLRGELEHEREKGYRMARRKVSLEQVARVPEIHRGAESWREKNSSWRPPSMTQAEGALRRERLAIHEPRPDEHRVRRIPRVSARIEGRVYRREGSIRPAEHRLVQRPDRMLPCERPARDHAGDGIHAPLRPAEGLVRISARWRRSPKPSARSTPITPRIAGRRSRWRRSISRRRRCCGNCWSGRGFKSVLSKAISRLA